jgi:hypothetical protein
MLKVTNLETTYNDIILALKGISLEVPLHRSYITTGLYGDCEAPDEGLIHLKTS